MLLRIVFIQMAMLVLVSACSAADPAIDPAATLPDPEVKVVEQASPEEAGTQGAGAIPQDANTQDQAPGMRFGLESHRAEFDGYSDLIGEPGMTIMRHNGLLWHEVEPVEGELDWSAAEELEQVLESASASGLETILIVRGTPGWAQQVPGSSCGPILPGKLASFADFMAEAVSRYSKAPYNVKYWELGNEPDVDPQLVRANSVFGCWGNQEDPFYGGGTYAEMLKVVYPVIKGIDPEAKILLGGLLLDCDPKQPAEGKDCSAGNFLEGVLRNGGGDYFDIVSFHGYAPYFGPETGFPYELYMDRHSPSWEHLGGVVEGKIRFISSLLEQYQVDKSIFLTEAALLCPEYNPTDCDPPDEMFYDAQADYAVRLFLKNWANGVRSTIWYQFEGPGWRHGGLLDKDQNPKPVYEALEFLTRSLENAQYVGEIDQFEGVRGYEFRLPEKRLWVLWSEEQVDIPIPLPEESVSIQDKFGNEISPAGAELVVNDPVYLVLAP